MMKFRLLLTFLIPCKFLISQNINEKDRALFFDGYISSIQSVVYQKFNEPWEINNTIHKRLNMHYQFSSDLQFNVSLRSYMRWWQEKITEFQPFNTLNDAGIINANFTVAEGKSYKIQTHFDRFNLSFEKERLAITLGRQRINWSQTLVWNPNDIFNAYSFFDIEYPERPGSDAIRIQYYPSETSTAEYAFKIDKENQITTGLLYRFNTYGYDLQFIGGILNNNDIVLGAGWSGSWFRKISFRGEYSLFMPQKKIILTVPIILFRYLVTIRFRRC